MSFIRNIIVIIAAPFSSIKEFLHLQAVTGPLLQEITRKDKMSKGNIEFMI